LPTYTFAGLVSGDAVTIANSGAVYSSKEVATDNKVITVSGLSITAITSTSHSSATTDYVLDATSKTVSADITTKALTMSGLSVPASRTYNGELLAVVTNASVLASAEAVGSGATTDGKPYTGDTVSITGTAVGTYNSKDVATATTVTYSGLSLTGDAATNYSLTIQSPASATITRLDSVTWSGGDTGDWLNPANWTGGAVPDLANVANVVIPTGKTISFNNTVTAPAESGTVSVDSITASGTGSLSISAGTLAVANNFTLGGFSQSGGTLTVGGNATINQPDASITQSGGTLTVTGTTLLTAGTHDITLTSANNFTGGVTVNGAAVQITDADALVLSGDSAVTSLTATAGTNISGSGTLSSTSGVTFSAGSGSGIYTGVISGAGTLTKSGAGTLTLSGANTYTGATTVSGGTLKAGVASVANTSGAFGKNSAVSLANTANVALDITGYATQIGSLTGGGATGGNVTLGSATLTVGGDDSSPSAYAGGYFRRG
jgi:autotransporter-associated beta strand protein